MGTVLTKACVFLLIILLGYALKKAGFFRADDFGLVSRIVLNITLPCAVITNFSRLDVQKDLLLLVLLGIGGNVLTLSIGYIISLRRSGRERAFHMINLSGFNIGSFAMPYVQGFLGPLGVVSCCMFDAGNSLMCAGTTYPIAASVAGGGGEAKFDLGAFLRRMFRSVPMDTYLVMLVLSVMHIALPNWVLLFTDTVGSANAFLAMLMIGIGFELRLERSQLFAVGKILGIRTLLAVGMALVFYFALPFPLEVRQVLVIVAFAPMSTLCPAFTHKVGGDFSLSSAINSASMVFSAVCITSLLLWMGIGGA